MTLTIPDVENWKPEQLAAAGEQAGTVSQDLDTAVGKGAADTKALTDGQKWSGAAGAAADLRVETEKTRASAVSAALLELRTAFTTQVQNLADAKAKVLRLRDDALNQAPPFEVAANGTVAAQARIAYLRAHSDKADVQGLVFQEALQAASRTWELTNALKTAEDVAVRTKAQVEAAVGKLETAFAELGEPTTNVPAANPAPVATTPASTASSTPTGNPASDRPSQLMSGHNNSGTPHGTSSGTPHHAGPSASAPTGPMPSGDVARWIAEAKQKLIALGYDPADIDERAIALIIEHESAGNPYAENRWDSNWVAGHPSKGLMQTIDSTFNAYKAPGHEDIWNPVDNIIAGVRYSIDRYGSLSSVPGVAAVDSGGAYQGY